MSSFEQITAVLCVVCMLIAIGASLFLKGSTQNKMRRLGFGYVSCLIILMASEAYRIHLRAVNARTFSAKDRFELRKSLVGSWKIYSTDDNIDGRSICFNLDGTATFGDAQGTWALLGSGKGLRFRVRDGDKSRYQKEAVALIDGQVTFSIESSFVLRCTAVGEDGRSNLVLTARRTPRQLPSDR